MARAKGTARREAIITSLLVIAGIVLAICLFAAGLFWRGKPTAKRAFADGTGKPVGQITGLSGRKGVHRGGQVSARVTRLCLIDVQTGSYIEGNLLKLIWELGANIGI